MSPTENTYAPVPSSSPPSSPRSSTSTLPPAPRRRGPPPATTSFERPQVPSWQRALLLAFIAVLFYLAFHLGGLGDGKGTTAGGKLHDGRAKFNEGLKERYGAEVVHAKRYSPEFKYRPAASPVIKERLKDGSGKIRLRGANPGGVV
ncbi:hypothetical protein BDY24DRAFT_416517 [Mrakia frigida]|uniref:uncharacterized protein n=1 Tax=Mrakia frigida TaxID=29902 RepID=UPI003FCBF365